MNSPINPLEAPPKSFKTLEDEDAMDYTDDSTLNTDLDPISLPVSETSDESDNSDDTSSVNAEYGSEGDIRLTNDMSNNNSLTTVITHVGPDENIRFIDSKDSDEYYGLTESSDSDNRDEDSSDDEFDTRSTDVQVGDDDEDEFDDGDSSFIDRSTTSFGFADGTPDNKDEMNVKADATTILSNFLEEIYRSFTDPLPDIGNSARATTTENNDNVNTLGDIVDQQDPTSQTPGLSLDEDTSPESDQENLGQQLLVPGLKINTPKRVQPYVIPDPDDIHKGQLLKRYPRFGGPSEILWYHFRSQHRLRKHMLPKRFRPKVRGYEEALAKIPKVGYSVNKPSGLRHVWNADEMEFESDELKPSKSTEDLVAELMRALATEKYSPSVGDVEDENTFGTAELHNENLPAESQDVDMPNASNHDDQDDDDLYDPARDWIGGIEASNDDEFVDVEL